MFTRAYIVYTPDITSSGIPVLLSFWFMPSDAGMNRILPRSSQTSPGARQQNRFSSPCME
jgi:hypothetical protein